ncbi:aromatic amino acid aminotransferas-like protein [Pseudovirgaria hyperparasitica]|uniref:Aromatic amino acid aminotransferas-like protein n=1 Tax=Pseudovirgaria hyperparasitica TaxID=470096 RepID=A0A6A6VYC1_9PEZI|nr:aromatic amino acid aminotransferas-like protein [Pseudovirgaria hyperparasitica]KAF2754660.1 aromatic amino acid aminotransferas-like protein [Pseudovirgaria hyperparasitica]
MVTHSLPCPVDLSHHLSEVTKSRKPSDIKAFYKYFLIPGIGQLAGGLPSPDYFPFDTLEARTAPQNRWTPSHRDPITVGDPSANIATQLQKACITRPSNSRLVVPKDSGAPSPTSRIDVTTALQYGQATGLAPLAAWIKQFATEHMHPSVPYKGGPDIVLSCGNTDGYSKTIEAFNNTWVPDRDPVSAREGILVEKYVYMTSIQAVLPRGMNVITVELDEQGMKSDGPGGLEDILENWDYSRGRRPHLLYTITIGQNPTGGVQSVERKSAIYELCVKYDIILIEDDPYWFLQFPTASKKDAFHDTNAKSSGFDFLDSLVPSYLSLDYEGRVVRLDTFSKTVAPGCRLGWITAQPRVIERITRITETTTAQPSGFVQAMIAEMVMGPYKSGDGSGGNKDGSGWEMTGWVRWLEGLRGNYERRMNILCDRLEAGKTIVKAGRRGSLVSTEWSVVETTKIYHFTRPMGGMFAWVKFNFKSHPLARTVDHKRLARALWIFWTTKPYLVLVGPGTIFGPTPEVQDQDAWKYFRMSYSAVGENELKPIGDRFVAGAHAFWSIKREEKIDDLLGYDEDPGKEFAASLGDPAVAKLTGYC